ncbi:MAG: FdrA family protein, partial [Deltaproteobacteria bacterium]|nr:FdrA family protein [Deltaproteobacteria bacterium]
MSDLVTIQRDRYYDSVLLLRLSLDLEETEGIDDAIVAMATEHNRGLLADNGYRHPNLADAGPNDLVIAVRGKNLDLDETKLQALVADLFAVTIPASGETVEQPRTLDAALARLPEAQLVLLSIPGEHAAREARRALDRGR